MAKQSQAWKALERIAAKKLGGTRKLTRMFNWGISDSDIEHPKFEVDCKYGKQVVAKYSETVKLDRSRFYYCSDTGYCFVDLSTFVDTILGGNPLVFTIVEHKPLKSYIGWLAKIEEIYVPRSGKYPLVVTKRPNERFEVVFFHWGMEFQQIRDSYIEE